MSTSDLYISDGSALPTLPDKHLTLTIMTLANRLAHYLEAEDAGRDIAAHPDIRVGDVQRSAA